MRKVQREKARTHQPSEITQNPPAFPHYLRHTRAKGHEAPCEALYRVLGTRPGPARAETGGRAPEPCWAVPLRLLSGWASICTLPFWPRGGGFCSSEGPWAEPSTAASVRLGAGGEVLRRTRQRGRPLPPFCGEGQDEWGACSAAPLRPGSSRLMAVRAGRACSQPPVVPALCVRRRADAELN